MLLKKVLQLIVKNLEGLHDDEDAAFDKRIQILNIMAKMKLFYIMIYLERNHLILQLLEYFLFEIRSYHSGSIKTHMHTIISSILDVDVKICKRL